MMCPHPPATYYCKILGMRLCLMTLIVPYGFCISEQLLPNICQQILGTYEDLIDLVVGKVDLVVNEVVTWLGWKVEKI